MTKSAVGLESFDQIAVFQLFYMERQLCLKTNGTRYRNLVTGKTGLKAEGSEIVVSVDLPLQLPLTFADIESGDWFYDEGSQFCHKNDGDKAYVVDQGTNIYFAPTHRVRLIEVTTAERVAGKPRY